MAETIEGYAKLKARIAAITGPNLGAPIMKALGTAAVREAKLIVPRKTGNLGRSIHVANVTATGADLIAGTNYARFVEDGTRPHEITPNAKKALRWAASSGGRRLTGSPTKAAQRGLSGGVLFAKVVHHPGTKPHPFLLPGAEKALSAADVRKVVVERWNAG